jgi:dolichol-phosphate mannosyltransferase
MINFLKNDKIVSVCIKLSNDINLDKISLIHAKLDEKYEYFELIILCSKQISKNLISFFDNLKNVRIIEFINYADYDVSSNVFIENCIGDYCAVIDPNCLKVEDLFKMLDCVDNYDVVVAIRRKKDRFFLEYYVSLLFSKIIYFFVKISIKDLNCDYFVINRRVINFITKNQEGNKFVRLLKYNKNFRRFDYYFKIEKNKLKKIFLLENLNYTIDLILSSCHKIIRFATITSISASIFNLFYIFYIIVIFIFKDHVAEGWLSSSTLLAVMNFILFLILAIFGEYMRMVINDRKSITQYDIVNEQSGFFPLTDKKNIDLKEND